MRKLITLVILSLPFALSAQSLMNLTSSTIEDGGNRYELVRVDEFGQALVRYQKYDEGILVQEGYYSNGKPTGVWHMYSPVTQEVISTMRYDSQGNRVQLSTEIENQKTTVRYEDDLPKRAKTRRKVQE